MGWLLGWKFWAYGFGFRVLSRVFGSGFIRVSARVAGRLSLQDVVSKVCNRSHGPVRVH